MEIWLIRHGETDWNRNGRVQGWTDIPLNATGRDQAKRLARWLKDVKFEHIYSSDLSRALDTAKAVASVHHMEVTTTKTMREQFFGQAEGLNRVEKDKRFPNGAPDAETWEALEQRVSSFLKEVASHHHTGPILVAAHGGVIRAALTWLGEKPVHIENTSMTRLRVEGGQFEMISINTTPHLANIG
jgi:broad specificity phosphatase PhoE